MNTAIGPTRTGGTSAWWLAVALACASQAHAQSRVESEARGLEERLRAPCCRGQMLDAHESPSVTELRRDLRERLASGQSVAQVERALVEEFGPTIVAVPVNQDPRGGLSVVLAVLLAASAALLVLLGRRWMRRQNADTPERSEAAPDLAAHDALDQRIDAELARLDGES